MDVVRSRDFKIILFLLAVIFMLSGIAYSLRAIQLAKLELSSANQPGTQQIANLPIYGDAWGNECAANKSCETQKQKTSKNTASAPSRQSAPQSASQNEPTPSVNFASISSNPGTSNNSQPTNNENPNKKQKPSPSSFNAQEFYSQVQIDMSLSQVQRLAGSFGSCAYTDVYPSTGPANCTWNDSSLSVSVSFQNNEVAGKNKTSL